MRAQNTAAPSSAAKGTMARVCAAQLMGTFWAALLFAIAIAGASCQRPASTPAANSADQAFPTELTSILKEYEKGASVAFILPSFREGTPARTQLLAQEHLAYKESDRVQALAERLRNLNPPARYADSKQTALDFLEA